MATPLTTVRPGKFGDIDLRILPDGTRVLLSASVWREDWDDPNSRTTTARAGLIHDGVSVPLALSFLSTPAVQLAAAHHDQVFRTHLWDNGEPMTRAEADRMIREIAKVCQRRARSRKGPKSRAVLVVVHWLQRWIIWLGLTIFSWRAWAASYGREQIDAHVLAEVHDVLIALQRDREHPNP